MTNPVMTVHDQFCEVDGKRVDMGKCCWVWCPGCDMAHKITIIGIGGSRDKIIWSWDGNLERPTFDPSIKLTTESILSKCHSYIRNGQWIYLSDCSHDLADQTVDMVPLPDWLVKNEV